MALQVGHTVKTALALSTLVFKLLAAADRLTLATMAIMSTKARARLEAPRTLLSVVLAALQVGDGWRSKHVGSVCAG